MTARLAVMTESALADAVLGEDPACLLDSELHDGPPDPARKARLAWLAPEPR